MTGLGPLAELSGMLPHYGVVLLRVLGLFMFVPIFGSNLVPMRARLGMASVLALAFAPLVPVIEVPLDDAWAWTAIACRELGVGLALGIAAKAVFAGIEGAAALVAGQSGFALASMVDPMSGDQALAPALFQNMLALALLLAADLHHLFIRAVLASYELLPPAAALPSTDGLGVASGMFGARLFTVTIELAAPALIVTVAVDLVIALVGKAMPQVPILLVGYPLKMAAGLFAMALLATTTGTAVGWIGRTIAHDGAYIVGTLAGR